MTQNKDLETVELMEIIANQLRKLSAMDLNDRNLGKCVSQSKEVGNLAGKAIALSYLQQQVKQPDGIISRKLLQ